MALNVIVEGEFRGVGNTVFTDQKTQEEKVYPYIRVEVEEETQKISCKPSVVKELEAKVKKGDKVKIVVRTYARDNNLKLSFVRWA